MSKFSAFLVSPEIIKKSVTLPDGSEHDLHFKQVSAAEFRRYQIAYANPDEAEQALAIQRLIQASLCEADGAPALTIAEAEKLTIEAVNALFPCVMECNGRNKDAGKG